MTTCPPSPSPDLRAESPRGPGLLRHGFWKAARSWLKRPLQNLKQCVTESQGRISPVRSDHGAELAQP